MDSRQQHIFEHLLNAYFRVIINSKNKHITIEKIQRRNDLVIFGLMLKGMYKQN